MKVLITGGAGFIGSHLTGMLLEQGNQVVCLDNLSTGSRKNIEPYLSNPHFQFVYESVMNEIVLDRLIGECDIIFHLAAVVGVELIVRDPIRTIETNVLGTGCVLRAANRYQRKIMLASTSEIYGKSNKIPFREDSDLVMGPTTRNRWSYANTKAMDEFLALAYHRQDGLPVVICRFFNTIGPRQTGQYGMVVPRFVQCALKNEPLEVFGSGKQSRCFTDVRDVCSAVLTLMDYPSANGQVFNIGSTNEISIENLACKVIERTSSSSDIKYISYDLAYEPGFEDMNRRVPDITKINGLIGFSPRYTLEETLDTIIDSFR